MMHCSIRNKKGAGGQRIRGFTLVELLVVLIILGLVASIAGPNVLNYLGSSKTKTARLQLKEMES